MMTSTQRRLFLGALCEGLSTDSAIEEAGITAFELHEASDGDRLFRFAYETAEEIRDGILSSMDRLVDGD